MDKNIDRQKLFRMAAQLSKNEETADALKRGDIERVMNTIPPEAAKGLREILSDTEAARRMLASAEAQKIIQMLKKGRE